MNWNEIIGQQREIAALRKLLITHSVAHAFLFCGPEGIGKRQVAQILAQTLLCDHQQGEPCESCDSCRAFRSGSHPDFFLVTPDGASIKIDQIRALQQEAALRPRFRQGRVFIIDEAEKMTQQAQNSLLKLLEEPPEGLVFILVASATQNLLKTIFSRCQQIRFTVPAQAELTAALVERGWPEAKAIAASRLSQGQVSTALGLLTDDQLLLRQTTAKWLAEFSSLTAAKGLEHAAKILEILPSDQREKFFVYGKMLLRDLLLEKLCDDSIVQQLAVNREQTDFYVRGRAWTETMILQAVDCLNEAETALNRNGNPRIVFEFLTLALREKLSVNRNKE